MDVFDLVAKLSLDSSEYSDGLNDAKNEGADFGSKLGSALGTAGKVAGAGIAVVGTAVAGISAKFADGISSVGEYADNIDKASQKIGISAEAYQEWDFIAQHSGTTVDSLKTAMKTLVSAVDSGNDAFEAIGLSMEDVQGMNQEELFSAVITSLQGMEEGTERAKLAQDLLGKSSQELAPLLNTSAEATEAMRQQVHELGGVLSDDAVKAGAGFEDSLQNLKTSVEGISKGALAEFLPAVTTVMDGLTGIFSGDEGGAQKIADGIDMLIENVTNALPQIMEVGTTIVESLGQAIIENLPSLMECATNVVMNLGTMIVENLPLLAETTVQIISNLAAGLAEALPELIPTIVDVIMTITNTLIENANLIIDGAIALIMGLAEGLINAIPTLIEKLPEIVQSLVAGFIENAPKLFEASTKLIITLAEGLIKALPSLIKAIPEINIAIIKGLLEGLASITEVGMNFIEGLWQGIQEKIQWLKDKISDFASGIVDGIKDIFGIHSPSKVFAEIGGYLAEGLGDGWDDEIGDVTKDINKGLDVNYTASISGEPVQMNARQQNIVVETELKLDPDDEELFRRINKINRIKTRENGYNSLAMA